MDYAGELGAAGLEPQLRGPWATIGRTLREQGWKLHLSTVPREAVRLMRAVVPMLEGEGIPFKVARDESVLRQLNEGALGPTQVGKFMTIYPPTNRQACSLAEVLERTTAGFVGPVIVTDLRLGDVLYARYGAFSPPMVRDRLGNVGIGLREPDGSVSPHRYQVPFEAPRGRRIPFPRAMRRSGAEASLCPGPFGPGYVVLGVLRGSPRGSVFLALDARAGAEGARICVLKEGRRHCCADAFGRDMLTRLRWQEALLERLHDDMAVPAPGEYFEVAGNGYLPLEYVDGHDLSYEVRDAWGRSDPPRRLRTLSMLRQVCRVVAGLHARGYVHRDVKVSNFIVAPGGQVHLIDLELAHEIGSGEPPYGKGTPGFMSPQQEAGGDPAPEDDVYGIGAVAIFLLTGIHPQRLLFDRSTVSADQIRRLGLIPRALAEVVARAVAPDPSARPRIAELEAALESVSLGEARNGSRAPRSMSAVSPGSDVAAFLPEAVKGLLHAVALDDASGLWLSQASGETHGSSGDFVLHRSANRGVAGVVYTLARLHRFGAAPAEARERAGRAVDWLLAHHPTPDDQLPGLHFGEAGVAVAIAEAVASGLVAGGPWLERYLEEALRGPLDWPDMTHGAAGQGIAALCCADVLRDPRYAEAAQACAEYLVAGQDADGGWLMPEGAEGLSGDRLTGFAHGAAGIVYFLREHASRTGDSHADAAAERGLAWLHARMRPAGAAGEVAWSTRDGGEDIWEWWCHGAPGIALAWMREHRSRPSNDLRRLIRGALSGHPPDVRRSNLSICHGLAGLGEIYLEAERTLGEPEWGERARHIGRTLVTLASRTERGARWMVEDGVRPTGDLMVGCGGIVHFLLRLGQGRPLSFPLLP